MHKQAVRKCPLNGRGRPGMGCVCAGWGKSRIGRSSTRVWPPELISMNRSLPLKSLAAALIVFAGTTQVMADRHGSGPGQGESQRERPSRAAQKCLSSGKSSLNRLANDSKHLIREALEAGKDAMDVAADSDPPLGDMELAALLESSLAAIAEAAAAAHAELDARAAELIQQMIDKGATEAQLARARMYIERASDRLDERAAKAAEKMQEYFDELFGADAEDEMEDGDEQECERHDTPPPAP